MESPPVPSLSPRVRHYLRATGACALALAFSIGMAPQARATGVPPAVAAATRPIQKEAGPLKVFILAGQSNMQGHAKLETLPSLVEDPEFAALAARLVDEEGIPREFESVRVSSIGSSPNEYVGPLAAGLGAEARGPKIGPEYAFGATVYEELGEPILIIKTAWGGKSLHTDFRSPSSGPYVFNEGQLKRWTEQGKDLDDIRAKKTSATGHYYREMIGHVRAVLADPARVVPDFDSERGVELAGFVWFQGWNDMVDSGAYPDRGKPGGYDAYSEALAHLIRDVRADLEAPEMPFVIGVLGVGGPAELYGPKEKRHRAVHQSFRDAMAAPTDLDEFEGSVSAVRTEAFWDHAAAALRDRERDTLSEGELLALSQSVSNAPYHYLGSAKVLSRIGEAFARAVLTPSDEEATGPKWLWIDETFSEQEVIFRRSFSVDGKPESAFFAGTCDNHMIVLVNGERVGSHGQWQSVAQKDIAAYLNDGDNVLEIRARNQGGPAGFAMQLSLSDGTTIVSDEKFQAALAQRAARGRFEKATVLGPVGSQEVPWSDTIKLASFDSPGVPLSLAVPDGPQVVRPAEEIHLLDGFEADLLYTVPNELFGSWVALTTDDKGRLYTSDQAGRGLFRITPAPVGQPDAVTEIESIDVDVSGAQGMCWAFDSLYVNVNGKGVWRITDEDGDDRLDTANNLIPLGYGGEHGPHAILPTPDGQGLYFIGGNHVRPPAFASSMAPSNWDEDLLLTRLWDAGGHARGMVAPGGWIARCDPDGKNIAIISNGYRNQYDIALNAEGEMFTYDSDMEWDIGTPWYRPTRVCHVTSGSEFGWRGGTGKWPTYYEDSTPPMLEVGPGSPTGVLFGAGASFPAKYQDALFVLDWTFGTIYALHLTPDGASYRAEKEDFAWSKPLGVTDAIVGTDGALYFTVGGRGSQSALYRIRYAGDASTQPSAPVADGADARRLRRSLESFHGRVDASAVEAAWPSLSSEDRHVRFAARLAIENQPVETWRARAVAETDPAAAAVALIALARQGQSDDLQALLRGLERIPLSYEAADVSLAALRAYALAFVRLGGPNDDAKQSLIAKFEALYPMEAAAGEASSETLHHLNLELARLLTYLGSDQVVPRTLAIIQKDLPFELPEWAALIQRNDTYGGPIADMLNDPPPMPNLAYALVLMDATEGWTPELREQYFQFFVDASTRSGGASYAGFLRNIRDEAASHLSASEGHRLADLLGRSLLKPLPDDVTPPEGPGQTWTLEEAIAAMDLTTAVPNFDRGKNLFHAVSCSQCHRMRGEGGAIGPDLSTVANKFAVADILESIIEPSKVISDQYGSHIVLDFDGEMTEGLIVEDGDEVTVYPRDLAEEPSVFDRSEIKLMKESSLSQMPGGLVDPLSPSELADLIAYLVSGGNRRDAVYAARPKASGGQ